MYPVEKLKKICDAALKEIGVDKAIASEVTACLLETSLRGVDSHGVNLLPHYINAVLAGRINPKPKFKYKKTSATTGVLDADDSFGHAAGSIAMKKAILMAKKSGSGFVTVRNSTHFSACSYYSLQAAREDMIGISSTHTDSLMLSSRGRRPYLGTNPVSFTFPCEGEDPICLDMATTQVTFNYIRLAAQRKEKIKAGLAVDKEANITEDPGEVAALMPMGDYKGYGLAFVVEVLSALLSGMPFGPHVTSMYKAPISQKRKLGHFFGVVDINRFIDVSIFKKHLKQMVSEMRGEPAYDENLPVLVPGDPEKKARENRLKNGIPLTKQSVERLNAFIKERRMPEALLL